MWFSLFWSHFTIQNYFLIWISRQTKKKHSPKTMSYSDQSFWFATPWSAKKWNLGKSGKNKSPVFANGEGRCNSFLKILNCAQAYSSLDEFYWPVEKTDEQSLKRKMLNFLSSQHNLSNKYGLILEYFFSWRPKCNW